MTPSRARAARMPKKEQAFLIGAIADRLAAFPDEDLDALRILADIDHLLRRFRIILDSDDH